MLSGIRAQRANLVHDVIGTRCARLAWLSDLLVGTLRNGAAGQRSIEQAHLGIAARPFAQAHRYSRHAEKRCRWSALDSASSFGNCCSAFAADLL